MLEMRLPPECQPKCTSCRADQKQAKSKTLSIILFWWCCHYLHVPPPPNVTSYHLFWVPSSPLPWRRHFLMTPKQGPLPRESDYSEDNCEKYRNFILFSGLEILWKITFSAGFWAICPKLCGNCAFPRNFYNMKLGEITIFCAMFECGQNSITAEPL